MLRSSDLTALWLAESGPSHCGNRLYTAGRDGTARAWDLTTGEELIALLRHTSTIYDLALNPDETLLATASFDATARVWDLVTGQELLVLTGHTAAVYSVAFSWDGRHLISASDDGTVRVYVLPTEELVALARARLTRGWKEDECRQFLQKPEEQCPPLP